MKYVVCFFISCLSFIGFGQSYPGDYKISAKFMNDFLIHKNAFGAEVEASYYLDDYLFIGISGSYSGVELKRNFGFETDRTLIRFFTIEVPVGYELVNKKRFEVSVANQLGIAFSTLRDKNSKDVKEYWDREVGMTYTYAVARKLDHDLFFVMTPTATASYRLMDVGIKSKRNLYVTGTLGYRIAFGKGSFSTGSDYTNFCFMVGLCLKSVK